MNRVLAIDAGASTGIAVVDFNVVGPSVRHLSQFKANVFDTTEKILLEAVRQDATAVVIEQFDLRPDNKFTADLSTVYRNGALEYAVQAEFGLTPVYQTPAQAKGLVSDKVLKRLGPDFWPTGKTVGQPDADDARDALRHAIHYGVTVLEHMPTIEKGWPNR